MGEGSHIYGKGRGNGKEPNAKRNVPTGNKETNLFKTERRKRAAERLRKKGDINAGYSPSEIKALTDEENRSSKLTTERASILDRAGKQLYRSKSGTKRQTSIPAHLVSGNTFTHNHPSQQSVRGLGNSLSGQDLYVAAQYGAKGARATSHNYTYDVKPGKNGWGNASAIKRDWDSAKNRISKEMGEYVSKASNYKEYETRVRRANTVGIHKATREVAKKHGLTYTRRKVR